MSDLKDDISLVNFRAEVERGIQYAAAHKARADERSLARVDESVKRAQEGANPDTVAGHTLQSSSALNRLLKHNSASADLIRCTSERGMSRASMERIWGWQLVNAVLNGEKK